MIYQASIIDRSHFFCIDIINFLNVKLAVKEKKTRWVSVLIYTCIFIGGVLTAYFSIFTIKPSNTFPFFELNSNSSGSNDPIVYGYNILEGLAAVATIIAVFIAWREFRKFQVENRGELVLRSVQEWYLMNKGTIFHNFETKKFNRANENWSVEVFNINEKSDKLPLFVIKNPTNITVSSGIIKISQIPDLYSIKKFDYSKGSCIIDSETVVVYPGDNILFYKDKSYNGLNFTKNFGVEITYISNKTNEKIARYFEAKIAMADESFYYIDNFILLEEKCF